MPEFSIGPTERPALRVAAFARKAPHPLRRTETLQVSVLPPLTDSLLWLHSGALWGGMEEFPTTGVGMEEITPTLAGVPAVEHSQRSRSGRSCRWRGTPLGKKRNLGGLWGKSDREEEGCLEAGRAMRGAVGWARKPRGDRPQTLLLYTEHS